jgi:ABC-2 type transport system permease protein
MYGLIWKDFLVLRKTLRLYVLFLLGYLGMALLGIFDLTFVTTFCVVILMILPISAFSYDEFARWDRYARTLPLSSRQIVGGRYLFVLLLLLVVAAIGAVSAVLLSLTGSADLWESLGAQLASLGAYVVVLRGKFTLAVSLDGRLFPMLCEALLMLASLAFAVLSLARRLAFPQKSRE